MFDKLVSFGSDLFGAYENRRGAKRQHGYSLAQMDYASQLKRKDATWMRDQLYGGKLTPWELSGQSGFQAAGPMGSGAAQAPSQGLSQLAETARADMLQEGQLENAREIARTQALAQIYSANAGDTNASQNAADAFKRDTDEHHFATTPQPTIPERQLDVNQAMLELEQTIAEWEKYGVKGWLFEALKPVLGSDTIVALSKGDKNLLREVGDMVASQLSSTLTFGPGAKSGDYPTPDPEKGLIVKSFRSLKDKIRSMVLDRTAKKADYNPMPLEDQQESP